MPRILLAGESWISNSTHYKGFDSFTSVTFHTGADAFIAAATAAGFDIEQIYAHDVPAKFPRTATELDEYGVIILSDIGANSFIPPETWLQGQSQPDALRNLANWTRAGGSLMMAGGYLSFQGFQARANFAGSAVEDVLPVRLLTSDDRVEAPGGVGITVADKEHPIGATWTPGAPALLGYNRVTLRPDADLVLSVDDDDVLLATRTVDAGRSLVWTSDIGPHWCPETFLQWDGFGTFVAEVLSWLAAR